VPYYAAALASLVPVRMATGVQLKLIESAYVGAPIIATPVSLRQAGMVDGVECVGAASADEWAEAIIGIRDNQAAAQEMTSAAAEWVRRNHSAEAVHRQLRQCIEVALAHFRSGSGR
jgi:glycosyltransferase involved in cell wall biosynthesis